MNVPYWPRIREGPFRIEPPRICCYGVPTAALTAVCTSVGPLVVVWGIILFVVIG